MGPKLVWTCSIRKLVLNHGTQYIQRLRFYSLVITGNDGEVAEVVRKEVLATVQLVDKLKGI